MSKGKESLKLGTPEGNEALEKFKNSLKEPRSLGAAANELPSYIQTEEELAEYFRYPDAESVNVEKKKSKDIEKDDIKFEYKGVVDKQIENLSYKLKDAEASFDMVKKRGTKEQVEERQKQIEFLKKEIEKAKETRGSEIARLKGENKKDKIINKKTEKKEIKKEEKKTKKEIPFSAIAAEITLARIDNYKDLWADTKQEGDKKFIGKTRELWKEFAVSGTIRKNKKGENHISNFTDLDGKTSIGLLNLAGINTKNIKYVKASDFEKNRINLDTGDRHGLVVEDEGKTAFLDHHSDKSGRDTSTAKITYETLVSLGLLEKNKVLDKLVEFVTHMDNKTYPDDTKYFKDSWRNLTGLQRFVSFDKLLLFFRDGRKQPHDNLTEQELASLELTERSKEQKGTIDQSLKRLEEMKKEGLIIDSEKYGKIAVDIANVGAKVGAGFDAVKAYGCGGYIIWDQKENSFFISTVKPFDENFNLSQGKKIRETMWIKPRIDVTPLSVNLREVLNKITDGKLQATGELEKFLEIKEAEVEEDFQESHDVSESTPPEYEKTDEEIEEAIKNVIEEPDGTSKLEEKIELYGGLENYNQILKDYINLSKFEDELGLKGKNITAIDREKWDKMRAGIFIDIDVIYQKVRGILMDLDKINKLKDDKIIIKSACEFMDMKAEELKADDKDKEEIIILKIDTAIKHRNYLKYRESENKNIGDVEKWEKKVFELNEYYEKKFGKEYNIQELFIDDFKEVKQGEENKNGVGKKLEAEAKKIEKEIEKMPEEEKKSLWQGVLNAGFYATKLKSDAMAWICDKVVVGSEKPIQEQGTIKRFLASIGETYKKDSEKAEKQIESPSSLISLKSASSVGQIVGGILKYGRTVADIAGWTVGSPLKYVMAGAQFFSRGAEAAREARLKNKEVIEKTRIKDIEEAAEQAWKIYEMAKAKAGIGNITKDLLEKSYAENLPQDLLERLKKSEPGMATGILQRILKKDLELAISNPKYSRVDENRLKEYDRMISRYGEVDALAMGAQYAETVGKTVIKGVQIETAALLIQRLPEIMEKLSSISFFEGEPKGELKIGGKTGEELRKIVEQRQEDIETAKKIAGEAAQKLELEKAQVHLAGLAEIKKEEGIEHSLIRQLADNPKKFGFEGNLDDKTEIKIWANNEAHQIAIKGGYVDSKTGEETWVRFSEKKPTLIILQDDKTIKFENADLYKQQFELEPEMSVKENGEEFVKAFEKMSFDHQEGTLRSLTQDIENAGSDSPEAKELEGLKESLMNDKIYLAKEKYFSDFIKGLENEIGLKKDNFDEIKNMSVKEFLEKSAKSEKSFWPFGKMSDSQIKLAKIIEKMSPGVIKVGKWGGISEAGMTIEQFLKNKIK